VGAADPPLLSPPVDHHLGRRLDVLRVIDGSNSSWNVQVCAQLHQGQQKRYVALTSRLTPTHLAEMVPRSQNGPRSESLASNNLSRGYSKCAVGWHSRGGNWDVMGRGDITLVLPGLYYVCAVCTAHSKAPLDDQGCWHVAEYATQFRFDVY
jgi:hypothetical protein